MFTDRKSFIVVYEDVERFKRLKKRFHCSLCGHVFVAGDAARWIYANGTPGVCTGNFFVCRSCDGDDETVLRRAKDDFSSAVEAAKRWGIYGPDWQHDLEHG